MSTNHAPKGDCLAEKLHALLRRDAATTADPRDGYELAWREVCRAFRAGASAGQVWCLVDEFYHLVGDPSEAEKNEETMRRRAVLLEQINRDVECVRKASKVRLP